jgi:nitrogen fixation protein FixH
MRIPLNWGTGIALVYTVFATATAGFVTFALGRPVELVSADYYEQSLRQDKRIAAERGAADLGPVLTVDESATPSATISLPAAQVPDARGTVTLYRPSDSRADQVVLLQPGVNGVQRLPLDRLAAGRWLVQLRWSSGGRDYYFERAVHLR